MFVRLFLAVILSASLAACSGGGGGGSAATTPVITPVTSLPTTPTGVTATAKDGYVLLDALPVTGATAYNIYWATTSGVSKANGTKLAVTSTPQPHTGLANGQPYYYVVTAMSGVSESAESAQVSATPAAATAVVDPLLADQWHLLNTSQAGATGVPAKGGEDINVQPAWTVSKGAGVRIAIVDDGLEVGHEDLASNLAANDQSYNYVTGSTDPTNATTDTTSGHGTSCAGIAAARDLNGLGGSGVAPRATLVGYNLLQQSTSSNEADAMTRNATSVGVSSNSWGAPDGTGNLFASSTLWQTAINTGLSTGRGGKGTVYVWAAGNGATGDAAGVCPTCVDNSNYDGQANYRGVMAVAAVSDQGVQSSYSESGANLLVSAPGGEFCNTHAITTTDRTGVLGSNTAATAGTSDYANTNYTKCMNGTSAATPGVAGVAALVLAANPNLGWRDVRIILAQTARKNDAADPGWALIGTPPTWFNHKYGFGVVNAAAAVTAAQTWTNVGAEKTYSTALAAPALAIPDNNLTGVSNTINVAGSLIPSIEFVEITFSAADHTYAGDLDVTLTSPTGKVSQLSVLHVCMANTCTAHNGWVFGSTRHLGESADGNWTLTVKDLKTGNTGTFQSWMLKFYGH